ncbi:MAG TPA: hypothetical protein VG605_01055 [Puia sp.]|nr:hypothetical protein [Puia sp.]
MKKAKIMFTSIAVLAIAGGVLAFNAKKTALVIYQGSDGSSCTTTITTTVELVGQFEQPDGSFVNATTVATDPCSQTLFYKDITE